MIVNKEQQVLIDRIDELCELKGLNNYKLSYRSTVPMTTLAHILDGTTKNPGIFTLMKLCDGLDVSLDEFFNTKEFEELLGGDEKE